MWQRLGMYAALLLALCCQGCQPDPMAGRNLSSADFPGTDFHQVVARSQRPVVVDFTAQWCGPCQVLKPLLKELEADGTITLVMIDVDQHPQIAQRFGVVAIPRVLFVKDGQVKKSVTGTTGIDTKAKIEALVKRL
jgi:thioredoxin 1